MDSQRFERLVAEAIARLPEEIRERLENIDIVVADRPTPEQLHDAGGKGGGTLLGLYEGVPLTERTQGYGFVVPDKISIFQGPIEAMCRSDREIVAAVHRVVRHEIAHHFGISDQHLRDIGRY
jgi:predicted Zn-dependent protease with MMP-like domain